MTHICVICGLSIHEPAVREWQVGIFANCVFPRHWTGPAAKRMMVDLEQRMDGLLQSLPALEVRLKTIGAPALEWR